MKRLRPSETAMAHTVATINDDHEWRRGLDDRLAELERRWRVTWTGDTFASGSGGWVGIVTGAARPAVIKICYPDPEAAHEHLAMRYWAGEGVARLLRAEPWALLLEQVKPGITMQTGVLDVVSVAKRLWIEAPTDIPALETVTRPWELQPEVAVLRDQLLDDSTNDPNCLLHGDLHGGNVLQHGGFSWAAIDPKPCTGPRAYDLAPWVINSFHHLGVLERRNLGVNLAWIKELAERAGVRADHVVGWAIVKAEGWNLDIDLEAMWRRYEKLRRC